MLSNPPGLVFRPELMASHQPQLMLLSNHDRNMFRSIFKKCSGCALYLCIYLTACLMRAVYWPLTPLTYLIFVLHLLRSDPSDRYLFSSPLYTPPSCPISPSPPALPGQPTAEWSPEMSLVQGYFLLKGSFYGCLFRVGLWVSRDDPECHRGDIDKPELNWVHWCSSALKVNIEYRS